jgi:rubrerythrin
MPQAHAPSADRETRDLARPLGRRDLVCPTCGYGVVVDRRPDRCPMCGGETWEFITWERFGHSNARGLRETNP